MKNIHWAIVGVLYTIFLLTYFIVVEILLIVIKGITLIYCLLTDKELPRYYKRLQEVYDYPFSIF